MISSSENSAKRSVKKGFFLFLKSAAFLGMTGAVFYPFDR